jgi:hypothetical protein
MAASSLGSRLNGLGSGIWGVMSFKVLALLAILFSIAIRRSSRQGGSIYAARQPAIRKEVYHLTARAHEEIRSYTCLHSCLRL